jgi:hypothetical protein
LQVQGDEKANFGYWNGDGVAEGSTSVAYDVFYVVEPKLAGLLTEEEFPSAWVDLLPLLKELRYN